MFFLFRTCPILTMNVKTLACEFASSIKSFNPLYGSIGSLDGIAIKICKLRRIDISNPTSYYHRKGSYAVPVQAICDAKYRFIFFSAKCAGPAHDSVAFSVSSPTNFLQNDVLRKGF